jgi:hypothetical protein
MRISTLKKVPKALNYIETFISKALIVSFYESFTSLFSVKDNTLVPDLFCRLTNAAYLLSGSFAEPGTFTFRLRFVRHQKSPGR